MVSAVKWINDLCSSIELLNGFVSNEQKDVVFTQDESLRLSVPSRLIQGHCYRYDKYSALIQDS